jgi:hypothetical protein
MEQPQEQPVERPVEQLEEQVILHCQDRDHLRIMGIMAIIHD